MKARYANSFQAVSKLTYKVVLIGLCVKERPRERNRGKMIVGITLPG